MANNLAQEIKQSEEYKAYKDAKERINSKKKRFVSIFKFLTNLFKL